MRLLPSLALFACLIVCPIACPIARAATAVPPPVTDWTVAAPSAADWDVAALAAIDTAMIDRELTGATSVLVTQRGRLVLEKYFGDGGPDVLNDTRSATKSVTALLVGAAIERGLLPGAQAHVYPYFTDLVPAAGLDPRKAAITVEDLLTMSAPWECDDDNQFSSGNEERMYVSEHWPAFVLQLPIKGYPVWQKRPADSPHGRAFAYCTGNPVVLGALLERVSKQTLAQFSADALEHPLGIRHAQWNRTADATTMGGGGTRYRSRDLAKFGQLLLDGGRWQGRQIVSRPWIDAMLTIHAQARDDADYGYLLWRFRSQWHGREVAAWAMSGNGGNYVFVVPDAQLVVVLTRSSFNQRDAHPQSQRFLRERILSALR